MTRRPRPRRRRSVDADEPNLEDDDSWVEFGGQLIWAAGYTEGGAPYGLTLDEWRRAMRSDAPSAGWVRARDVLETLLRLQSPSGARIELGRVTCVGEGMFRQAFAADVEVVPDANSLSRAWVALLPRDDLDDDDDESHASPSRELQLLAALQAQEQLPLPKYRRNAPFLNKAHWGRE